MVTLIIAFEQSGRRPLSVATVRNPELLQRAALVALHEAEQDAAAVATDNPTLAMLRAAEVVRLRTTLAALMPGIILEAIPAHAM